MGWVIGLIALAIAFAVIGLLFEAVKWFLIIAGVLVVFALVRGFLAGRESTG